jgi:hypothetical protein
MAFEIDGGRDLWLNDLGGAARVLETALATLVNKPLLVAGIVTAVALFAAAGIALHRMFWRYFVPRWIIWSYLVNGVGVALIMLTTWTRPSDVSAGPLMQYVLGAASAGAFIVVWPLIWMYAVMVWVFGWKIGAGTPAVLACGPIIGSLLGAAVAANVHSRLRQRLSRRDADTMMVSDPDVR